jgi:sterol 3beta-glucosyltransferase
LLPVPDDFPPHVHVTGSWFLGGSADWKPPPGLASFLESGPPPIYIGFGSMGDRRAQERTEAILEAVQRARQRAIVATGWGGVREIEAGPAIYFAEEAPHDWLFPQTAAVVHHGGAGTTAAGLRAGKPSIVCPFLGDQPFWGMVVHRQGLGPRPIPQKRLTAARLAAALAEVAEQREMRARAEEMGEKMRAEDGVARAVEVLSAL